MATLYGAIWDPQDDYHRIPGDAGRETAPIEEQYHFVSEYTNFDIGDRFWGQNMLVMDSDRLSPKSKNCRPGNDFKYPRLIKFI